MEAPKELRDQVFKDMSDMTLTQKEILLSRVFGYCENDNLFIHWLSLNIKNVKRLND